MKKWRKGQLYDRLHRITVTGLVALTGYGCFLLSMHVYRFFTVVQPAQRERLHLLAEEKISNEQLQQTAELLQKQKEAETLIS